MLGYSVDEGSTFGGGFVTGFEGDRALFGADLRVTAGRMVVATELLYANLEPVVGITREPWGGHATFGFKFTPKVQGLARLDLFEPDDGLGRRDWVVFGFNVWPPNATEFQVNYIIDSNDASPDNHQLLVNFQFGF